MKKRTENMTQSYKHNYNTFSVNCPSLLNFVDVPFFSVMSNLFKALKSKNQDASNV